MVYYVAGSNESSRMTADIYRLDSLLKSKGVLSYNSKIQIKADGEHKEWFWRREFAELYRALFFDVSDANQKLLQSRLDKSLKLIPNPANDYTEINSLPFKTIQVLNDKGVPIFDAQVNNGKYKLDVSKYPNGLYYVIIDFGSVKVTKNLEVKHN